MKDHAKLPQNLCYPVDVDVINMGFNADMDIKVCEHSTESLILGEETKPTKEHKRYVFKKRSTDKVGEKPAATKEVKPNPGNLHGRMNATDKFKAPGPVKTMKKTQSVNTTKTNARAKQIDENVNYANFKNTDLVTVCKLKSQAEDADKKFE